jgi:phosphoribosylglycinamide formyltransferase 1
MRQRRRVGILISGRGSNMAALIEAAQSAHYPAEIAVVISNRADAPGLAVAAAAGVATEIIDHRSYAGREEFDDALDRRLRSMGIDLIACAGFMRIMSAQFVARWLNRMINIHPSLLPAYRGLRTHEQVIADGAKIHGCTVHFVRPQLDEGPIIIQAAVPVLARDDAATLAARVLKAEHRIYPMALEWLASDALKVEGERVVYYFAETETASLIVPEARKA